MAWTRRVDDYVVSSSSFAEDHRKALQQAEQERAAIRQRDLEAQASSSNEPRVRVTIWERLHALSLPRSDTHPLVALIARQTGLTVREVHDEQKRRTASGS